MIETEHEEARAEHVSKTERTDVHSLVQTHERTYNHVATICGRPSTAPCKGRIERGEREGGAMRRHTVEGTGQGGAHRTGTVDIESDKRKVPVVCIKVWTKKVRQDPQSIAFEVCP